MDTIFGYDERMEFTKTLHIYLRNNNQGIFQTETVRDMTTNEQAVSLELYHLNRQMGILICELIVIRALLIEQTVNDLKYIANNINRITFSLVRQRKLLQLIRKCYEVTKPDEKEEKAIALFVKDIRTRLDYLRKNSIPSNIELTPLKEYIDILGGEFEFTQELRREFMNRREEMFDEDGNNVYEPMREYANRVVMVVTEKGMIELYRKRLDEYLAIEKAREEKKKQEIRKEKIDFEHNEAVQGMNLFTKALYSCLRSHKENEKIGVYDRSYLKKGGTGLRRCNEYIVLNCRLNKKGELEYRYVDKLGHCVKPFIQATHHSDYEEAEQIAKDHEKRYPNMVFTVFDLSDEFGNMSGVERVV